MQETYWQKRLAEPKGWVEYNPKETFVIHVQWVVANRVVAGEMLAALRRCAAANCPGQDELLPLSFSMATKRGSGHGAQW